MTRRSQVVFLLAIVVFGCLVQAAVISRAAVPALDAVRFVRAAQSIEQVGLPAFLNDSADPPLFAVWVWSVHLLLTTVFGDFREAWALSAQLAAALPIVLLPVPVFLAGKSLVGARRAVLGTILVAGLPELIRLGADGISDSTHLLLFAVALSLLVAHFLPHERLRPWAVGVALAGAATALAYLTRPEAAILGAAFAVVLLSRWIWGFEAPWRSAVLYSAGVATILVPYALLLGWAAAEPVVTAGQTGADTGFRQELVGDEGLSFAPKDPTTSIRHRGVSAAVLQLVVKLPKSFGYLPGIVALVGLAALRRRPSTDADLFLQAFCFLFLAAVLFHTAREGYLAARHLLPVAVAAVACLGAGAQVVADELRRPPAFDYGLKKPAIATQALVVATAVAILCVVYAAKPLHYSHSGHRSAAEWLARHAQRGDRVVDTRGWTGLFSGLATVPYENARLELSQDDVRFLVIEERDVGFNSRRSRTIQLLLERAGTQVAAFPEADAGQNQGAKVLVYRWDAMRHSESAGTRKIPCGTTQSDSSVAPRRLSSYRRPFTSTVLRPSEPHS